MPRKPLGPEQTICQAQDATRPEGGSQTPNHRDKEKQTGGVSACPTPPVCQRRCGVRHRPNPADAPQRSSPARATHKGQGDHDPKPVHWLGETRHLLLDQEEGDLRVRGADQLVWASLERGDTTPKATGQGPRKRGYRPGLRPPRGYFQKDEIRIWPSTSEGAFSDI